MWERDFWTLPAFFSSDVAAAPNFVAVWQNLHILLMAVSFGVSSETLCI